MAFTFIESSIGGNSSATTLEINGLSIVQSGDIIFAFVTCTNLNGSLTIDGDFTAIANENTDDKKYLCYKISDGNEPALYSFSNTFSGAWTGTITAYRMDGLVANDPIDVISNTVYSTSNTTVRAASMNITKINTPLILFGYTFDTAENTFTKPNAPTSDWVEDNYVGSTAYDMWNVVYSMLWTSSGDTGDMDITASATPDFKHAFAVSLNFVNNYIETQTDNIAITEVQNKSVGVILTNTDNIEVGESNVDLANKIHNDTKTSAAITNDVKNLATVTNDIKHNAVFTNQHKT